VRQFAWFCDVPLSVIFACPYASFNSSFCVSCFSLISVQKSNDLLAARSLLLSGDGLLRALADPGIRARSLSSDGQSLAMSKPCPASDVHLALDVFDDLTPEIPFDSVMFVDLLTYLNNIILGQILSPGVRIDSRGPENFLRRRQTDSMDVRKRDLHSFPVRYVNTRDTWHLKFLPLSTLALLMPGVFAYDHHSTMPSDDLALETYFLDASSYFHFSSIPELKISTLYFI